MLGVINRMVPSQWGLKSRLWGKTAKLGFHTESQRNKVDKSRISKTSVLWVSRADVAPCVRCFSGRGMGKRGGLISWLKQAPRPLQMPHLNKWVLLINKSSTLCEEHWGYTVIQDKYTTHPYTCLHINTFILVGGRSVLFLSRQKPPK